MPWLQARLEDPTDNWIRFPNGFVNVPMCCPSRASILTGQYAHHHGVTSNRLGEKLDDTKTLATWLDAAGYRTGLFGKYLNDYGSRWRKPATYIPPGWDEWVAWLSDGLIYFDYGINDNGTIVSHGSAPEDYSTDVYRDAVIDFIESTPPSQPFFVHFSPNAPHKPLTRAPRHENVWQTGPNVRNPSWNEADVSDKPAWVRNLQPLSPSAQTQQDTNRRAQYGTLAAADEAIAQIVATLEERGELEETVIIVLSDNGFAFGEHRWTDKGCPYEACSRVPFFVRYPGAFARTASGFVSNVDVAPTFVDLADATATRPMDGVSLDALIRGSAPTWRDEAFIEFSGLPGGYGPAFERLRTPQFSYTEYGSGEIELYDLAGVLRPADPDELANVCPGLPAVCQPAYAAIRADLAARLQAYRD